MSDSSLVDHGPRYVWGRRWGRRWLVQSARVERGAKRSEVVVRAFTRGGARRLARRKVVPETWMVLNVEPYRGR